MFTMRIFVKHIFALFFVFSSPSFADKTSRQLLNETHFCFEVEKSSISRKLSFIGRELGKEKFRVDLAQTDFQTFAGAHSGNFSLDFFKGKLFFEFWSDEGIVFQVSIDQEGKMELCDHLLYNMGFDREIWIGLRTFGTIVNEGHHAFHGLVSECHQLHNFGTLQIYNSQFFQSYFFNKGAIKIGQIPESVEDLTGGLERNRDSVPNFKQNVFENYGQVDTGGKFNFKSAYNFHEHGNSFWEDVSMSSGDLAVQEGGGMNVLGTLSGTVRDISVPKNGSLNYKRSTVKGVRDLNVGQEGVLSSEEAINLRVSRNYTNQGSILSDDSIDLTIENTSGDQAGILYAPKGVKTRVLSVERANQADYENYIRRQREEAERERRDQEERENARKEREEAEKEIELQKRREEIDKEYLAWSERLVEAIGKDEKATYDIRMKAAGCYMNDKGQWVQRPQKRGFVFRAGFGSNGIHFGGHTAGYDPFPVIGESHTEIRQQAELYREQFRADLYSTQAKLRASMEKARISGERERRSPYAPCYWGSPSSKATPKAGTVYTTMVPAVAHVRDSSDIVRTLRGAGADVHDISAVVSHPIILELQKLRDRPEETSRVSGLAEITNQARVDSEELYKLLDSPAQRFIDRVAIPVMLVGSILFPPLELATGPVLTAACVRMAPALGRAAATYGVTEIYDRLISFLRPHWSQSEKDVMSGHKEAGRTVQEQVSFKCGKPCGYGEKGSIRVDGIVDGHLVNEVKNFSLTTNQHGLIKSIADQAIKNLQNLPKNIKQLFTIDVRGQVCSVETRLNIVDKILARTQGILTKADIDFLMGK